MAAHAYILIILCFVQEVYSYLGPIDGQRKEVIIEGHTCYQPVLVSILGHIMDNEAFDLDLVPREFYSKKDRKRYDRWIVNRENYAVHRCQFACSGDGNQWKGGWYPMRIGDTYPNQPIPRFQSRIDGVLCYCVRPCVEKDRETVDIKMHMWHAKNYQKRYYKIRDQIAKKYGCELPEDNRVLGVVNCQVPDGAELLGGTYDRRRKRRWQHYYH